MECFLWRGGGNSTNSYKKLFYIKKRVTVIMATIKEESPVGNYVRSLIFFH
jgi:hypothetical protein